LKRSILPSLRVENEALRKRINDLEAWAKWQTEENWKLKTEAGSGMALAMKLREQLKAERTDGVWFRCRLNETHRAVDRLTIEP
jgi:hypothetical protein